MPFKLDHLVITVNNLEEATSEYAAMGFTVTPGGVHASGATQNALIYFQDGSYLELLAPTGQQVRTDVDAPDYTPLFQHGEGLIGYALLSDNLAADVAAMRTRGIDISDPKPGGRTRPDGAELLWKTASIGDSWSPFFIEDTTARPLRVPTKPEYTTHQNGALGVVSLNFTAQDMDEAAKRYEQLLGYPPDVKYDERAVVFALTPTTSIVINPISEGTSLTPDAPLSYTVETSLNEIHANLAKQKRPDSLMFRLKSE
jgi:hypothetical protein